MIDSAVLEQIDDALKAGRPLDGWEAANATRIPLKKWPAGKARRKASALAGSLGSRRLSNALDWLNWREHREEPAYYHQALFSRAGVISGHRLIPEIDEFLKSQSDIKAERKADLLGYQGRLFANLRDFTRAGERIKEALDLAPEVAWIHVEHSMILEMEDRYEDSLAASEEATRRRPYYRPSVLQKADVLVHLGRDDEALAVLHQAHDATQNAAFAGRLQAIYSEREDHEKGLWCLDEFENRSPMMEKSLVKWLAGRRADFHYMAGDLDKALEWCDKKGEGYQKTIAKNLRKDGARERKRVRLDVPFVRQHSMTCAPATLAALAAYWGRKFDHLEIAEAICHEGTPWHKERQWAEENGFLTREFRLTEESLHQLIDQGIPFTLTTQATTSAHLQACTGYDARTGSILLRDPTERHFGEMIFSSLVERHPLGGPRGMVLLPPDEQHRLQGVQLPDSAVFDAYHELLVALDGHDRWKIEAALSTLRAVASDHALCHEGEERVAFWLQDSPRQLDAINAQLRIAPDHQSTLLQKCSTLRRLDRWEELRSLLEDLVSRDDIDPIFYSELGELLMEDARELPRAEYYLRKAVRLRPSEGRTYESLARCRRKQQKHEETARLRRISSCLAAGFEPYARAYFDSCRILKRPDEGLEFLRQRAARFGAKDAGPWITLAECLNALNRSEEAVDTLQEAVRKRPDDGSLRLQAGSLIIGWAGKFRTLAQEWMEGSRGSVPELAWFRETAHSAAFLGDRKKAIRCWRSVLEIQPFAIDAWRGLARMIAEEEGEDGALRLLDQATEDHPDLPALWALKAEWLAGTKRGPLDALNRLLELDPRSRWALRERSLRRLDSKDQEGAEADAREAIALDPWEAESHGTLAAVLKALDRMEEAKETLKQAIRLKVDYTYAAESLVGWAEDRSETTSAIKLIELEMRRQVSNGEIVPVYQDLAWSVIQPPPLLRKLQDFCKERPDLWQTWSARIRQALRMRLDGEALSAATSLTEAFPLLPRAWLALAEVHRLAGRHEDEEAAAAQACELSPGWDEAARCHALVLELLGRPEQAIEVLRRASQLDPLNGPNHGRLAEALRRNKHEQEAFEVLRSALSFCPNYHWGWETLATWAVADDRKEEVILDLREASGKHGHLPSWWITATDVWGALGETDEAIAAARQGLKIAPGNATLRDQLAHLLFSSERYEEALAVCEPQEGEESVSTNLQGRRAWILMHSGQPLKGVAAMKELVEREPDYSWGLGELAQWYDHREDWKNLRDLCMKWSRASTDVRVLGYLGRAERALNNNSAAKKAFARAHALDPEYSFAARQLLDLQLIDNDLEDAATTLAHLQHYVGGPYVICDGIELDLKRSDSGGALRRADELLSCPEADFDCVQWAQTLFKNHQNLARWKRFLEEKLKAGSVAAPGGLPVFLSNLPENQQLRKIRKWIEREPVGSENRTAAWLWWIQRLGTLRKTEELKKLSKSKGVELKKDGRLWHALGNSLLEVNASKEGAAWLADWQSRPNDVDCSTLINVSALLDGCPGDHQHQWKQSAEVRKVAFRRFPDQAGSQAIRAGHALDLAASGKIEEARSILQDFELERAGSYYQAMGQLAHAVVAAASHDEDQSRAEYSKAISAIGQYDDLGTLRTRERAEQAIASHFAWAKGKPRKLRKRWGASPPPASTRSLTHRGVDVPYWVWVTLILIGMRACRHMLSD